MLPWQTLVVPVQGDEVPKLKLPEMVAEDAEVRASNAKLVKKTIIIMAVLTAVSLVIILGTFFGMRAVAMKKMAAMGGTAVVGQDYPDLVHIFRISAFTFLGVIAAEFLFLYGIAAQYKPLDPNDVKKAILQATVRNISQLQTV